MLSQAKPYPKSGADAWFQMVTFSLTIDKGLPTILFNRMKKKWNKMSEDRKRLVCKQFLPDAIRRVTSWTQSTQTPSSPKDDSFKVFWELALKCYMEEIDGNESNFALALRECGGALTNLEEYVLDEVCTTANTHNFDIIGSFYMLASWLKEALQPFKALLQLSTSLPVKKQITLKLLLSKQ